MWHPKNAEIMNPTSDCFGKCFFLHNFLTCRDSSPERLSPHAWQDQSRWIPRWLPRQRIRWSPWTPEPPPTRHGEEKHNFWANESRDDEKDNTTKIHIKQQNTYTSLPFSFGGSMSWFTWCIKMQSSTTKDAALQGTYSQSAKGPWNKV